MFDELPLLTETFPAHRTGKMVVVTLLMFN